MWEQTHSQDVEVPRPWLSVCCVSIVSSFLHLAVGKQMHFNPSVGEITHVLVMNMLSLRSRDFLAHLTWHKLHYRYVSCRAEVVKNFLVLSLSFWLLHEWLTSFISQKKNKTKKQCCSCYCSELWAASPPCPHPGEPARELPGVPHLNFQQYSLLERWRWAAVLLRVL